MHMETQILDDILVVVLGKTYTVETIEQVMSLVRADEIFENIRNVIIDCTNLEFIDNGGGELFLLKRPATVENLLFCGLASKLKPILNFLAKEWFNEEIRTFPSRDEAIKFIGDVTK